MCLEGIYKEKKPKDKMKGYKVMEHNERGKIFFPYRHFQDVVMQEWLDAEPTAIIFTDYSYNSGFHFFPRKKEALNYLKWYRYNYSGNRPALYAAEFEDVHTMGWEDSPTSYDKVYQVNVASRMKLIEKLEV